MAVAGHGFLPTGPLVQQIGVIVCSQRKPRVGPQIATFVLETLQQYQHCHPSSHPSKLSIIDLADHPLPFFDEPIIPSRLQSPSGYTQAHTRAWSELVNSFAAFVFVTPQYNWGYPANLKNAIDYLFYEWTGKPAMIISYGGHGGGMAAAQLKQVLQGLRMKVVPDHVELRFPDRDFTARAVTGTDLGLQVADVNGPQVTVWAKEAVTLHKAFEDLLGLLAEPKTEK